MDGDIRDLKAQTNPYAVQTVIKKRSTNQLKPHSLLCSWKPVTLTNMSFLGLIFHMCISGRPRMAVHWCSNPIGSCNFCSHVMSRLRYIQIHSFLQLTDNHKKKSQEKKDFIHSSKSFLTTTG
ncbi:uncharacterized protein LOC124789409 [Schistocerca piceifrons]|uniref:uncharacterized protein LOC124789409 n=1 Tax=Schistocerca piceifrons TaxID=274613 RepID=UPI001F5E578C|nr:uncharacterized protein LOC124789409 [Schistocerca piceifrons]